MNSSTNVASRGNGRDGDTGIIPRKWLLQTKLLMKVKENKKTKTIMVSVAILVAGL